MTAPPAEPKGQGPDGDARRGLIGRPSRALRLLVLPAVVVVAVLG